MNKIQLEATLQLAEIDCENNPNQVNKNRVAQAKAAFDAFMKAQDEPAAESQKPSKPAAPKKPSAPAPKKEKVVPDATDDTTASADRDASDEGEETEEKKTERPPLRE